MALSGPDVQRGASVPGLTAGQRVALDLMQRPTLLIPVPSTAVPRPLVGGQGILAAAVFRESGTVLTPQTFLGVSSANAAAANNVVLPAGGAGITTWVTGFDITGAGATAGSTIAVTVTGVVGGPLNYRIIIPAGAGVGIVPLVEDFGPVGLPGAAVNQAITVNVPSFGAGNTDAAVTVRGYQQTVGSPLGAGLAAPTVVADLLDGTDSGGEILAPLDLPPFGLYNQGLGPHGPFFTRGLFLNLTAGTLRGAVYVKI
jgi:hypothetical protein